MIRVVHSADWHLDSPLTGRNPAGRRAELMLTAERIFTLARKERANLILLAGDLFDNVSPYAGTEECLMELCAGAGRPVLIAPGNHDCLAPSSPYLCRKWPGNVHIFTAEALRAVEIKSLGCRVWGAAFTSPERYTDPLAGFVPSKDGMIDIVLVHADVTAGRPVYGPVSEAELNGCGADYIALGHIHRFTAGKNWCYPGCPEGRGFDETGDKGAVVAEVGKGRADIRFVSTAKRKYLDLRSDAMGSDYPLAGAIGALSPASGEDICRLTLTGYSGPGGVDLERLTLALRDRWPYLELRDETEAGGDLWDRAENDTLLGRFLGIIKEKWDAANEEERKTLTLAARYGLAALEGRRPPGGGQSI